MGLRLGLGLCLGLLVGLGLFGFGPRQFGHDPLGIRLGGLRLFGSLTGGLTLLHDRLFALERLDLFALLVVAAALGRVLQDFIGTADLGEAPVGIGVVAVLVGVHALGFRPPGRLDLVGSRIAPYAKH